MPRSPPGTASRASGGVISPLRKASTERAGVPGPGVVGHVTEATEARRPGVPRPTGGVRACKVGRAPRFLRRHPQPARRPGRIQRGARRRGGARARPRRRPRRSERRALPAVGLRPRVRRPVRRAFWTHVQEERREFAASLDGERAERFAGIKIDGILEASLSVVVTYDPARGAPDVLGRHAIADAGLYSVCLAIENMWLACTAEGWGMGWVSFYRESFLRELLGIPAPSDRWRGSVSARSSTLAGHARPRAHGWRERLPLEAALHLDHWDRRDPDVIPTAAGAGPSGRSVRTPPRKVRAVRTTRTRRAKRGRSHHRPARPRPRPPPRPPAHPHADPGHTPKRRSPWPSTSGARGSRRRCSTPPAPWWPTGWR